MKKVFLSIALVFLLVVLLNPMNPKNVAYAENEQAYKAVYLVDTHSGQVLKEYNAEQKVPVASIIKLMTVLLTLENIEAEKISLDDVVVASQNASNMGGSQVFIENGGQYKVKDLLKSVIVSSANDASVALAEYIAGSEDSFVTLMNKRAQELGLTNTNFCNATGLPVAGQFSCAKDVAIMLNEVIKHPMYFDYSTIWIDKLLHSANRETELVNTNKLIRYFKGCDGGKTGSTNEAGYCLAATAKRGDMRLIGVVLGVENGKERFYQTSELLNFGFNGFTNNKLVSKDDSIENNIKIKGGKQNSIEISAKEDVYYLTAKTDKDDLIVKYELKEEIKAPMKAGSSVGTVYVIKNNEVVAEEEIILLQDIDKLGYVDSINKIVNNWKIA